MLSVRRFALLLFATAILGAATLGAATRVSRADGWPSRPVTVIVPFGAGGNTDMMARLGAQHLTTTFGQTFVIENRPSAGGAIGSAQVSSAAPDGYTLMFAAASVVVLTPQVQKLSFDPGKQLVPLSNIGTGTQMVAIRRDLPAKTLPEFIAYAKANPGKLNFTVAGTQNVSHLAPVLLFAQAGIDLVMVPQKSEPQAISDLMAGQVDVYFGNSSSLLPHIDSDKIRLIAVGTPERIAAAPDIPTVAETIPGFQFSSWNGFFAPAATPEPIAAALRKEISSFARSPEIAGKLSKLGIIPGGLSFEECVAALKKEHDAYAAAIKVAGIVPAN